MTNLQPNSDAIKRQIEAIDCMPAHMRKTAYDVIQAAINTLPASIVSRRADVDA